MKKLLTLVLALAMTLSLAACGGGGEDTADEGSEGSTSGEPTKMTLILRGGAYGESLEASLAPFEAEHNVDIEVMLMSFDDLHTGIALDAVNEVGTYDLCMVDGSWMAEFTENGVLANLSEMGYSFDDDIIPATTTICKVGEDIYLAPYYGNVTVMMYNKQLLADAGYAPEDIDSFADLMDIAQKTKAADSNKNGFLIRGGSADNILSDFLPHLVVHGGWVVDENNNPTVDTPEFKAAMQEYLDLYALGSTLDKDDIVAFLRVYTRSVDMMKKTSAEELADDYMRFYNAWTGKTMTREEAIRDIKDHPVYSLDEQLALFKQSYGTSELREWLHGIVSFQNEAAALTVVNFSASNASIMSPTFI